jgi:exodeoxyribonuclease-3
MKIFSWNVNGYRAICGKGFDKWFRDIDADVIGLQEVKAHEEAVDPKLLEHKGYQRFWSAAKKPGYSGTAVWTRVEPLDYQPGLGIPKFDDEGRVQVLEFKDFYFLNCYFPNSQDERARLPYKMEFNAAIMDFCKKAAQKGKSVIVQGDFNVAHAEIDIKNAKTNTDSPGFYIEERNWMSTFLKDGTMRDVFRERHPGEAGLYTWWSYRANARANNVGWRIDYHILSPDLVDRVKDIDHQRAVVGSDHCPLWVELKS